MLMGALVGGMLGLLGGLLGEGFARFLKHISGGDEVPKWPRVIGVILAVTLTRPAIEYINKPTAETVMRELETKEPIYLVLKQKTPDVYAKIMSDIDTSIKSGDGAAAIRMKIQSEMRLIYSEKLPHASDASLLGWVQLVRDEERSLDAADPSLCVAMLSGQGGDVELDIFRRTKKT